jgi:penicillin amidase
MRLALRTLIVVLGGLIVLVAAAGLWVRAELNGSLPVLDGSAAVTGLSAPVTVSRDALGVPTITGAARADVARGLGFVHAQDRFFQMDLQRRQPAGELSALVGARAFELDRQSRLHRFRVIARTAYERTAPEWRDVLDAYADGVNAGLAALDSPPFEYLMLRAAPDAWRPEDTILTILAMFNTLQGRQPGFERTVAQMRDAMPEPLVRFLTAAGSEWETPVVGQPLSRPPIPSAHVVDLRQQGSARGFAAATPAPTSCALDWTWRGPARCPPSAEDAAGIGSNNWAVAGAQTRSGAALVANDMHLELGVPNIWYRASMTFPDPGDSLSTLTLTGVTLPGLPSLVVGSNGYVAWGLTNSNGDWSDLVRIDAVPGDPSRYLTPGGPKPFEVVEDAIAVGEGRPRPVTYRWTIWGPVVWTDRHGRDYAQRWVAHDPDVVASDISRPERARTIDEVLLAAAGLGIPNQNFTAADRSGRIGWTIAGVIPRRVGFDGFTPESWADGSRRWDGYVEPSDLPRIVDPANGRIWTANAPVVDGAWLTLLGDGGYSDGVRARIIRDRLLAIERATPADMLAVQLDDTALFLERWRTLAAATLDSGLISLNSAHRGDARRLIAETWTGRASTDSVAYRLVRAFRTEVVQRVFRALTEPASTTDPAFDYTRSPRSEGPVWTLVTEKPAHLAPGGGDAWDRLLADAMEATIGALTVEGRPLASQTWGEFNRARIGHPLAAGLPQLARWLTMPADPLPGDVFTPRAHSPRAGPSERLVVSPGRETEGILHMPGGQSAHPWSPHFRDMHQAWLAGEATPLLPGPAVHMLTLMPPA